MEKEVRIKITVKLERMRPEHPATNHITNVTCFTPTKKLSKEMNRSHRDRTSRYTHHSLRSSSKTSEFPSPYEETLRSNHSIDSSSSRKFESQPRAMAPGSSSPSSLRSLVHKIAGSSNNSSPTASQKTIRNASTKKLSSTNTITTPMTNEKYRARSPTPRDIEIPPENRTTEEILNFLECQRDETEPEILFAHSTSQDPFSKVYANSDVVSSIWDEPTTPLHTNKDGAVVNGLNPTTPMMTSIPFHEFESDLDSSPLVNSHSSDNLIDTQETSSQLHIPDLSNDTPKIQSSNSNLLAIERDVMVRSEDAKVLKENVYDDGEFTQSPGHDSYFVPLALATKSDMIQPQGVQSNIPPNHEISVKDFSASVNIIQSNPTQHQVIPAFVHEVSKSQEASLPSSNRLSTVNHGDETFGTNDSAVLPSHLHSMDMIQTNDSGRSSPQLNNLVMTQLLQERDLIKEQYEKINHEIFSTVNQQYILICQQYDEIKCEKDAAVEKLKHLEIEIERLQQEAVRSKGANEMMNASELEQVQSLNQTIEVNKRRIGYLSNENQKLRKENSEWRELCQELMSIIESKGISNNGFIYGN